MFANSKTRILGALLVLFGALQAFSETVRDLLSPTGYVVFTIVVGVLVTTLGALKRGEGSFLAANRTWLTGVLLIVLGAVQQFSEQIQSLVSPQVFAAFTVLTGVGVAVLGFLNAQDSPSSDSGNTTKSIAVVLIVPLALLLASALPGCAGTGGAYKAAGGDPVKVAYVVAEHYSAVVKEAAALKNSGTLTGSNLEAVRKADDAVRPLIIGDPVTGAPGIRQLSASYEAVRSAKNLADLEVALNAAVEKLTALINALKKR